MNVIYKTDKTIETVIRDGLCTVCGTCVGLCPLSAIEMVKDESKGFYIPRLDKSKCNGCGICFKVCPGHAVDFKQLNTEIFGKQPEDILLGNYLNCYVGHATDYDIRYKSASGGIVTALLIFALEQGIINGALVTRMNKDNPLEPESFIAMTREEIISATGSKYCPVPANIALNDILTQEGKFAVVGLPCHIHGVRKAEAINEKLKSKIALHIGIICSHNDSFKGTEFILRKYGVEKQDIAKLDYRGMGWPGKMDITFKNGGLKQIPYTEYIPLLHGGFFMLPRCAVCCDQAAELADISCGDAWLPDIMKTDSIGASIIISRTPMCEDLLTQAISKKTVTLNNIEGMRVRNSASKKDHYTARSRVAHLLGKKIPSYDVKIPGTTALTYCSALVLLVRMFLSRRYFQWLIVPTLRLNKLIARGTKLFRQSH